MQTPGAPPHRTLPKLPRSDSFKEVRERPCIRCGHLLTLDGGQLLYCSVCGAPQIFLSEELQQQTSLELQRYAERAAAQQSASAPDASDTVQGSDAPQDAPSLAKAGGLRRQAHLSGGRWPLAVDYALLAGGVALGLDLLGLAFGPVWVFALLWAAGAPVLTVGFFHARAPNGWLRPGFAARLGLLTALLVALGCGVVVTLNLLLSRFVLKNGIVDTAIAAAVSQMRATTEAQSGPGAAPLLHLLGIPEFRVGFLLWVGAVTVAMYLIVAVASAGIAGLLLSRRPTRGHPA